MKLLSKIFICFCMITAVLVGNCYAKDKKQTSTKSHVNHPTYDLHSVKGVLETFLPGERIEVRMVKNSITLSGHVSSAEVAHKAEKLVREFYGEHSKILNLMSIKSSQQVMLRVRVGEVINNNSTSFMAHHGNFEAMERSGIIKILAEPNLVAMSGEKAEFLAGGEFPVPVAQKEGAISIDYKSYGVRVGFMPLVINSTRIRLNIDQEFSEISNKAAVSIKGFNIPSVDSRRTKTTVELAPGESFMIAGLIKDDVNNNKRKTSELVISVTPYLVDPMQTRDVKLPTDVIVHTQLETKFLEKLGATSNKESKGKPEDEKSIGSVASLNGPVGYIAD